MGHYDDYYAADEERLQKRLDEEADRELSRLVLTLKNRKEKLFIAKVIKNYDKFMTFFEVIKMINDDKR